MRPILLGLAAAGVILLQACAPITRVIDTPKDGARIDLNVEQGMQVRWSNLTPGQGTWVLESPPKGAVTLVTKTEQPGVGGGIALDIFDFKAASAGAERLTFVYRNRDGAPTPADERISVEVAVG